MNDKNKKVNKKENDLRKQTIKNIVFKVVHGISYVCTGLFVAVCIVACATQNKSKANADTSSVVVERIESPKYKIDTSESVSESDVSYPIYDDENYSITLSAYQLNNYCFENLMSLEDTGGAWIMDYTWSDGSNEYVFSDSHDIPCFTYGNYSIYPVTELEAINYLDSWIPYDYQLYYLYYFNDNLEEKIDFNINLKLTFNNSVYQEYKNAIQLDIQANEETIDVGIFEGLTTSITSFISTLNTGLTAIIGIFWNNGLTPLGILSTLVVGVALVYFIFRLVIGLIRLRG